MNKIILCIPTLNPKKYIDAQIEAIKTQSLKPSKVVVIDSSSTDHSIYKFHAINASVLTIKGDSFNHGGTRNKFIEAFPAEFYLYLTQDAIFADRDAIHNIFCAINKFENIGVVYGRQLPFADANLYAQHARLFNYPSLNNMQLRSMDDIRKLGIKAAFCSNSFAIYRKLALQDINFFNNEVVFGEDTLAAAKMLSNGWLVGYEPNAKVHHSHNYNLFQEFSRYFDVGVFHTMHSWFLNYLGRPEGEGYSFIKSEVVFLKTHKVTLPIIRVIWRNIFRFVGYKIGKCYYFLPKFVTKKLSMNKSFWT